MDSGTYKIGSPGEGGMAEFHYPDQFNLQEISGMKRMVVGPSADHVGLMLDLSDLLPEPFRITYVLVEPIGIEEQDVGRFEMETELTRPEMREFFTRFREFFESDARHHVWLTASTGSIIYDQHNILFLYGPIIDFEQVLLARGLTPGEVIFPYPHMHRYHPEMNPVLDQLLHDYPWRWFPLDTRQDVYR